MPTRSKPSRSTSRDKTNSPKTRGISFGFIKRIKIAYILFFLLIVAAFLIGVLFTKVQYLEKGPGTIGSTDLTAGNPAQPAQPAEPVDVDQGHLPILGNKDAKVTVIEFSDFQCPFCEQMFKESLPQIKKDYIDTGKIKFAYRHYPISSIHPNAQKAAEASECANDQGNFWDYHDQLFENQADWEALDSQAAQGKFVEYANAIGLDGVALGTCVSSGKNASKVKKDLDAGTKAGVTGTPATFVNGILIEGAVPYEEFKSQIDKALKG